jgi:peptidoglycan/xylan/chitin deacetylase (PgdA/CDA1 family)
MKKPILMIHEVTDDIFKLNLERYTLTFDDGLYSQFYYYDKFQNIKTEKIYFISTNNICSQTQSLNFPPCRIAHEKASKGNKEDYMTIDQIKYLSKQKDVFIGGHSHDHVNLNSLSTFKEKIKHIKMDTVLMMDWFDTVLNYKPTKFCYPFNDDFRGFYKFLIDPYEFTEYFSHERIPVETLLHN